MKIKLGNVFYTPFIRTRQVNGKEQVMWEIVEAEVIGIRKSKFEGRWSDEDLAEALLVKFKIEGEEHCVSEEDLKDPEYAEGFSLFPTSKAADDYALTMIANDYYDGNIDEDAFVIEDNHTYKVMRMIENHEKEKAKAQIIR